MGCELSPEVRDGALDALALIDAYDRNNQINQKAIWENANAAHLMSGLIVLGSMLRATVATSNGCGVDEVDALFRAWFLLAGDVA